MSFDASGIVGAIVVIPLIVWVVYLFAAPAMFRRVHLPQLAKRYGWRIRTGAARAPRDLPGDGGQSWETPLPGTTCEFLGLYRGRPVHGVQVGKKSGRVYNPSSDTWSQNYTNFCVISVAMTDRPYDDFHSGNRVTAFNGDPIGLYPDFAEFARNRLVQSTTSVRQDGHGFRAVGWKGRLNRKRLLRALDELTG